MSTLSHEDMVTLDDALGRASGRWLELSMREGNNHAEVALFRRYSISAAELRERLAAARDGDTLLVCKYGD